MIQFVETDFVWILFWLPIYNWLGEGNGNPLQYSCLENYMDRGAWWAAVHGVAQSWTWLKWVSMHACIGEGNGNPLQHSCLENPRDRGACGLPSMGLHRVRHGWSDLAAAADSILKSRDITLPTKVHLIKAMVFPVIMYDVRVGL